MDPDSDMEDFLGYINPNESEFFYSDDEYKPDKNDESSDDDDDYELPSKRKRKRKGRQSKQQTSTVNKNESNDEDDIPLAEIRDAILHQREEEAALQDELYSRILDEPMWARVPFNALDCTFTGDNELRLDTLKTPYQFFSELITDDMLENIEMQSSVYAMSKNGLELCSTKKEIEQFIAIYLRMGLMKTHCVRAYWASDTRYPPVADVFTRIRFGVLCRNIHVTDNDQQDHDDRIRKLRPWLDRLKENLEKIPPSEHQSVDKIMVAFKGRCVVKQYMVKKPHKWGIKIWAPASSDGILHDFSVYQGSSSAAKSELGVTGQVVMDMTKKLPQGKNFKIFADNLFSSLHLVKKLRGMQYAGTVRKNRLKGCTLRTEKAVKKKPRGSFDSLVVAVRRYDNKCVCDFLICWRRTFVKSQIKKIEIPCPAVIKTYKAFIRGADLLDAMTALYKSKIKTRRWYLYVFYHTINMQLLRAGSRSDIAVNVDY